ncbi:JmjC domain-containing protein [Streptomyces sp. NPDC004284]|uniref:JmjC domain-containing protein n=1 Tax=Streptomyces sp. NPDC004284 TaxID=3364695 RepID=UPI003675A08B
MDHVLPLLVPDDRFFGDTWQKRPAHFPHRPPAAPAAAAPPVAPITLSGVERALNDGVLRHPYLEIVTKDGSVHPDAYCPPRHLRHDVLHDCPDPAAVRGFLDAGATLLLRHLEQWHRPTARTAAALARETGRRVEVFCFLTPPGTQGRPVHKDDADVLVLHLHGRKRWRVHRLPADGDGTSGLVAAPGPVALEPDLGPGDVLYVPRGCPHSAEAGPEGLSVHLSFTLREVDTADLLGALHPDAAASLPAKPLGDEALLATAQDLLAQARRRLDTLTPAALLAGARALKAAAQAPAAPETSFGPRA